MQPFRPPTPLTDIGRAAGESSQEMREVCLKDFLYLLQRLFWGRYLWDRLLKAVSQMLGPMRGGRCQSA